MKTLVIYLFFIFALQPVLADPMTDRPLIADNETEASSPECDGDCNTHVSSANLTDESDHRVQSRVSGTLNTGGTAETSGGSTDVSDD